jgi:hypothetical protein
MLLNVTDHHGSAIAVTSNLAKGLGLKKDRGLDLDFRIPRGPRHGYRGPGVAPALAIVHRFVRLKDPEEALR